MIICGSTARIVMNGESASVLLLLPNNICTCSDQIIARLSLLSLTNRMLHWFDSRLCVWNAISDAKVVNIVGNVRAASLVTV